jgi:hypothetical protein
MRIGCRRQGMHANILAGKPVGKQELEHRHKIGRICLDGT